MTTPFTSAELESASALVHQHFGPTPQYAWPLLAERVGAEVWVKHENHTPTGAFKVRGGLVYLDDLVGSGGCPGIVTATRGNHGQSIPFAAKAQGIPVKVYVPEGNSSDKNRAMTGWGAEVIVHGRDFEEARLEAVRVGEAENLHLIPPFHPLLVRGVATYGLELFTAVPDLDAVYVPIGMGSGICSLIAVRDLLGAKAEIVGVVSAHADSFAQSFAAGHVIETETANTFADGMACRAPWAEPLDIILKGASRVVSVTDDEVAEAIRIYYHDTHNIAEGAGAAPLAALLQERQRQKGRKVATILCGGNIDANWMATILEGGTPKV